MDTVRGQTMQVSVLVDGRPQTIYRRRHDNQAFVAGIWGKPFVLEVRNLTPERVELLNSVDGRNSLRDEEANVSLNRGMIVGPYGTWSITGWRIDDAHTREFKFTDPMRSVEQKATGAAYNAGVFGFALFQEYKKQPVYRGDSGTRRSAGESLGVPKGGLQSFSTSDMGTGMGQRVHDVVGHTTFSRATANPVEILTIQYRSYDWLEMNGILVPAEPQAFPGSSPGSTGYARYEE